MFTIGLRNGRGSFLHLDSTHHCLVNFRVQFLLFNALKLKVRIDFLENDKKNVVLLGEHFNFLLTRMMWLNADNWNECRPWSMRSESQLHNKFIWAEYHCLKRKEMQWEKSNKRIFSNKLDGIWKRCAEFIAFGI